MQGFEQRDKYKRFYQASQDKSTVEPRFTYTDITLLCTVFFVPGKSPGIFSKLNRFIRTPISCPIKRFSQKVNLANADTSLSTACYNGPFLPF